MSLTQNCYKFICINDLHKHIVKTKSEDKQRLADYLTKHKVFGPSKSFHKKEIKAGRIKINNEIGTTANFVLAGDTIIWQPKEAIIHDLDIPGLKVLFEDDHLAVIFKPPGIETRGYQKRTIQNALHNLLSPTTGKNVFKPQAVHRLDYATAGVLMVGKYADAIWELGKLFQQRRVQKKYLAVCRGRIDTRGEILETINGLEARTYYQRLTKIDSDRYGQINLVGLVPITGRRHQLRIHMDKIGHPILGDKLYGNALTQNFGQGLYLLSHSIKFRHPITKEMKKIQCTVPKKYIRLFPEFFKS